MTLIELFTAIADAIRAKKETTDKIVASNFPDKISNLETEGITNIPYYIKSLNMQNYVDTGIKSSSKIKFKAKFSANTNGAIIIGNKTSEEDAFRIGVYNNQYILDYGSGYGGNRIIGGSVQMNTPTEVEVGNRYVKDLTTGEIVLSADSVEDFSYDHKIKVCACDIYYLKIYENDKLVRDFIPVKLSDGTLTLFDKCNQKIHDVYGSFTSYL